MARANFLKPATRRILSQSVALGLAGLAFGWLIGLSVSPVIQGVITALLALAVGVAGVLAGIRPATEGDTTKEDEESKAKSSAHQNWVSRTGKLDASPWPVACLVVAVALGSSLGVFARVSEWLSPDPHRLAARWTRAGLSEPEVIHRLFDQLHPSSEVSEKKDKDKPHEPSETLAQRAQMSVLFGILRPADVRSLRRDLRAATDAKQIEKILRTSADERLAKIAKACGNDPESMLFLRDLLCDATD